jgi:MacB-like protein
MRQFLLWLRGLVSGIDGDRDLDDEVRTHLELLADDYMRQGMTPKEARYAARKAFGGVEQMKEAHRDWRRIRWVEVLLQDTRYALRQLKRKPGAAITGVLTLSVSIGAVVAVFALTQNVVFRPLSYPTADRLVAIHSRVAQFGRIPVSDTQYRAWRGSLRAIDGMALLWAYEVNLSGSGDPERVAAARVSPDLFRILGVHPQLGRLLRDDEDQPGRDRVVLLSDRIVAPPIRCRSAHRRQDDRDERRAVRGRRCPSERFLVPARQPSVFDSCECGPAGAVEAIRHSRNRSAERPQLRRGRSSRCRRDHSTGHRPSSTRFSARSFRRKAQAEGTRRSPASSCRFAIRSSARRGAVSRSCLPQ